MNPRIHSLHVYPVKSCQGIQLQQAELVKTGIKFDRHWMVVDKQGNFLSQREHPKMAAIGTNLQTDELVLNHAHGPALRIPLKQQLKQKQLIPVTIWNDQQQAALVSKEASLWFSEILDQDCDLVYLPDDEKRPVDPQYASKDDQVGFADGFPLLVVSLAIIDQLNEYLQEDLNINRFRPNIVLSDCPAHAEDAWTAIIVNHINIHLAKPCSRCVIPSIDQQTSVKHPNLLKTLARYRRREGKIYVGQNGIHASSGVIRVGDSVEVIV